MAAKPRGQLRSGQQKRLRGLQSGEERRGAGPENPVTKGDPHVFSCGEDGENGWRNTFKDKGEVQQEIQQEKRLQASKDQKGWT